MNSIDQIVVFKVPYEFPSIHRTFNAMRMVRAHENIETPIVA